jgi:hypothetical protein
LSSNNEAPVLQEDRGFLRLNDGTVAIAGTQFLQASTLAASFVDEFETSAYHL